MSYTLYLFAMNGEEFARRLADSAETLLVETRQRILDSRNYDEDDLAVVLEAARRVCAGDLPEDCDGDYFDALYWIGNVAAEPVPVGEFDSMKYWYLEAVGIWPWMRKYRPPFPVPRSRETPPEVGYLPAEAIRDFALPAFDALPKTDDAVVRHGRNEFQEVLESLADDNLDLLGVLI